MIDVCGAETETEAFQSLKTACLDCVVEGVLTAIDAATGSDVFVLTKRVVSWKLEALFPMVAEIGVTETPLIVLAGMRCAAEDLG